MSANRISVIDAISFGFKKTLEHMRLFVFVALLFDGILFIAMIFLGLFAGGLAFTSQYAMDQLVMILKHIYQHTAGDDPLLMGILFVIIGIVFIFFDFGFKRIVLDIYDHNKSELRAIYSQWGKLLKGVVGWILYGLIVAIGLICFVFPGIIAYVRFSLFPFFLVDKNVSAVASLRMSYNATKQCYWEMFGFVVIVAAITSFTFSNQLVSIFVGFITVPLANLAYAYVYRQFGVRE